MGSAFGSARLAHPIQHAAQNNSHRPIRTACNAAVRPRWLREMIAASMAPITRLLADYGTPSSDFNYSILMNTLMLDSDLFSLKKSKVSSTFIVPSASIERFSMRLTAAAGIVVTSELPSHLLV